MRWTNDKVAVIAIDHGYGNIKTANSVTPTGITAYDSKPTFEGNILCYGNKFYRIGEGCGCPVDTSAEGRSTDRGDS